jgi:hypothetical protein
MLAMDVGLRKDGIAKVNSRIVTHVEAGLHVLIAAAKTRSWQTMLSRPPQVTGDGTNTPLMLKIDTPLEPHWLVYTESIKKYKKS